MSRAMGACIDGLAAGPPVTADRRIHVVQGDQHVSGEPDVVLVTLLGSCVAACIRDPVAGVGGMNHFLLPGGRAPRPDRDEPRSNRPEFMNAIDSEEIDRDAGGKPLRTSPHPAPDMRARRHGVHAMELLVNALLSRGARRERLEAKLFGGARLIDGLTDVGFQNADFAERFLADEGIRLVGGSLRGEHGRRVQFWPVSGRARQSLIERERDRLTLFDAERRRSPEEAPGGGGSVELF